MTGLFRRISRIVSPRSDREDRRYDEQREVKSALDFSGYPSYAPHPYPSHPYPSYPGQMGQMGQMAPMVPIGPMGQMGHPMGPTVPAGMPAGGWQNAAPYHDHSRCLGNNHYAQCAEIWDNLLCKWVPFDPKDVAPKSPTKSDEWNYFCVTSRYNDLSSEPHPVLTHFAQPLLPFVLQICGSHGTWGSNNGQIHDVEMGQAFRTLKRMKKELQTVTDILEGGSKMTIEDKVALARSFGHMVVDRKTTETELKDYFEDLKKQLNVLVNYLDERFKPIAERLAKAIQYGYMEFDLLPFYFEPGQTVSINGMGRDLAMTITRVNVDEGITPGIPWTITVYGYGYTWNGHSFQQYTITELCHSFIGTQEIPDLPVRLLTPEKREALTARGRKFREQAGIFYRVCNGDRIVIDRVGYLFAQSQEAKRRNRIRNNHNRGYNDDVDRPAPAQFPGTFPNLPPIVPPNNASFVSLVPEPDQCFAFDTGANIDDELLCFLPNEVYGYNLAKKSWEIFSLEAVQPIEFDSKAWDHLVLDADVKTLIKGLVEVTTKSTSASGALVNDVIARKGGGLTSVLYGPPGTGKTLTAEAIAESLQRPLLSVGSSDLPREPSQMEDKLKYVLNLATSWDAIVLIDEADVFLEQRSLHEIERNALVSVALRVLEYHHGVVFLTTNRIKVFDEAFLSRFSIAVKYPELDKAGRYLIWSRFFEIAGYQIVPSPFVTNEDLNDKIIPQESIEYLATKNFNGRTIKNLIRTAQALALSSSSPLKMEHIDVVVRTQEKFLEDFEAERVTRE